MGHIHHHKVAQDIPADQELIIHVASIFKGKLFHPLYPSDAELQLDNRPAVGLLASGLDDSDPPGNGPLDIII